MKKILILIFLFCASFLVAQERHISGYFSENLVFYSDTTYIIDYNTRISSSATLFVLEGARIKFSSGASVTIDGGLEIRGSIQNKIFISSIDNNFQGIGFVISGHNGSNIHISFTEFKHMLIPLRFKDNWYRENILVEDNVFKNINTGQEAIYIGSFSQIYSGEKASFNFLRNNFIENNSTIYLSPIEDDILQVNFQNNLITSNYMISKELENPMNAAISFYYDKRNRTHFFDFNENSVFNNNVIYGTGIDMVKPLNIGVSGSAESLEISRNYFGNSKYANNSLVHFFQDNQLPLILLTNLLPFPSEKTHSHIWKIMYKVDEQWLEWSLNDSIESKEIELKVFYNREVILLDTNTSVFSYYNEEKKAIFSKDINFKIIEFDGKQLHIVFNMVDLKNGAIELPLAKDSDGFVTPKFLLGNYNLLLLAKEGRVNDFTIKKKVEKKKINELEISKANNIDAPTYQISTSLGVSLFKGDVFSKYTIQKPAFKLELSYQLTNDFIINFDALSTTIFSENNNFLVNKNIKTDVLVFSGSISHLLEEIKFIHTSLEFSIGASLLHFNPKVALNGYYVSIDVKENNQLSIPLSFSLKTKVNKNYNIGISIAYYKTFTDHIDNNIEMPNTTDDFITLFGTLTKQIR